MEPRPASWGRRVLAALLLLVGLAAPAAGQETGTLEVRLQNPPERGILRLVLFDQAPTFGRFSDPARIQTFEIDGRASYVMDRVPPGTYALVAHHDENANGEFDKNFIGIPTERLAISRGYRPKGPPIYARASFELGPGETRRFDMEFFDVLGKLGRLGVGVGVIGRSTPYVDSDAGVFQPIPSITYVGERLQWFGPSLRFTLVGSDRLRLAATGTYRLRAYEESDSPVLAGLGDRKDTLLAGFAVLGELPATIDLGLGYEHDVLDRIGGGVARLEARRSFQWRIARFTPKAGLVWTSSDLANHDFGVPADQAAPGRPAYAVGDVLSYEVGLGTGVEITRSWRFLFDVAVEFLPSAVTDSPIVGADQVVKGFVSLNFTF